MPTYHVCLSRLENLQLSIVADNETDAMANAVESIREGFHSDDWEDTVIEVEDIEEQRD